MIYVSAGHHPGAPGAKYGHFIEHDEAIIWQQQIMDLLGADIAIKVPTGHLTAKIDFINTMMTQFPGPNIAIEIHFNMAWKDFNEDGTIDPNEYVGKGSETLYYPKSNHGKELAEQMQEKLSIVFEPNRGAKEGWYHMESNKPDAFLSQTNCPALIIEPEFVHHANKIIEARDAGCQIIADMVRGFYHADQKTT